MFLPEVIQKITDISFLHYPTTDFELEFHLFFKSIYEVTNQEFMTKALTDRLNGFKALRLNPIEHYTYVDEKHMYYTSAKTDKVLAEISDGELCLTSDHLCKTVIKCKINDELQVDGVFEKYINEYDIFIKCHFKNGKINIGLPVFICDGDRNKIFTLISKKKYTLMNSIVYFNSNYKIKEDSKIRYLLKKLKYSNCYEYIFNENSISYHGNGKKVKPIMMRYKLEDNTQLNVPINNYHNGIEIGDISTLDEYIRHFFYGTCIDKEHLQKIINKLKDDPYYATPGSL